MRFYEVVTFFLWPFNDNGVQFDNLIKGNINQELLVGITFQIQTIIFPVPLIWNKLL